MGGEIGVDSSIGVGSTFWLSIPMKIHESDETKKANEELESLRASILQSGPPPHAILVSSSDATLLWMGKILSGFILTLLKGIEEIGSCIQKTAEEQVKVDFIVIDHQSERSVEDVSSILHATKSPHIADAKTIHLFTPTSEFLSSQRPQGTDQIDLVRMTKPVRTLRLLQTIADLKNVGKNADMSAEPVATRGASESIAERQEGPSRTLYGNVLIAEGKDLPPCTSFHTMSLFF